MLTIQRLTRADMDGSVAPNLFILLLTLKILSSGGSPEAGYQLFKGFNLEDWTTTSTAPNNFTTTILSTKLTQSTKTTTKHKVKLHKTKTVPSTTPMTLLTAHWQYHHENTTVLPNKKVKMDCPEAETPTNIGPYEVPTERDLVLHTMKTLHRLFASYHQKAMLFLDDVQKVVTATDKIANKCRWDRVAYKQCVKSISNKCEGITKSLVVTLEQQRQDILEFGQDTICSLNAMKEDPVKLIKILASEEASLEFALPGFLRLLSSCNALCHSPTPSGKLSKKPTRYLTDTDVVIRHFLTKKNYKRLIQPRVHGNGRFKILVPTGNKRKP